ncbi:hypothetical protein [Maridesulfovibrio frigidus]|uniref:hypothetical protein n=1 Tax=Maridesulfovibrio frigidus TaxID=340956 RepID=UPI00068B6081|nr:hypothetical protein [Maridesulfovibrio frigidus]
MHELFIPLAVMLSPRGLTLAGNGAGQGGIVFAGLLILMAVLSLRSARSMGMLTSYDFKYANEVCPFIVGVLDSARVFALGAILVSSLGIAGYAVNEVFALWFPNLGASFLILALAVSACFLPVGKGRYVFIGSLGISVCSFLYVAFMTTQVSEPGFAGPWDVVPAGGITSWLNIIFLAVLAFIGFDLAFKSKLRDNPSLPSIVVTALAFILFLWGALLIVSPDKIADSYVAHFKVARIALGSTGRILMAITVVLGTFAATFGVFRVLGSRLANRMCKGESQSRKIVGTILAVTVGGAMATGWAGEPALDSLIAAGLSFWFIGYALVDLVDVIASRKAGLFPFLSALAFVFHVFAAIMSFHLAEFQSYFGAAFGGMLLVSFVFAILRIMKKDSPSTAEQ